MISSSMEPVDEIAELQEIFDVEHRDGAMIVPLDNIRLGKKGLVPLVAMMVPDDYPAAPPEIELFGLEQVLMAFQLAGLRRALDAMKARLAGQKCLLDLVELVLMWVTDPLRGVGASAGEVSLGEVRRSMSSSPCLLPHPWISMKTLDLRYAKIVGEGVHGKVYKVYHRRDIEAGEPGDSITPYAAKRFLSNFTHTGQDLIREIGTLARLSGHPYVAVLHGVASDMTGVQLLMSYHNRTLHDIHFHRDLQRIRRISYQLMVLAGFMKEQKVIHRDWKPANLLWDDRTETIKLADFGQSRFEAPRMWYKHIFTLDYRPPEVSLGASDYTNATDVWSIALIIYFMAVRGPLFDTEDHHGDADLLKMILRERGVPAPDAWPGFRTLPRYARYRDLVEKCARKPPKRRLYTSLLRSRYAADPAWQQLVDLLSQMLALNPTRRIPPADALKHPFFHPVVEELSVENGGDAPSDPQIRAMREAAGYTHPPPADRTPLSPDMTDTDAHVRSVAVMTVLSTMQTFRPLPPRVCLTGLHLFHTFVDQAGFTSHVQINALVLTACLLLVHKFDNDHYFDEDAESSTPSDADGSGSEESSSLDTDEYLSKSLESESEMESSESRSRTSSTATSASRNDSDSDEEEEDDEEDEEEEEEEGDDEDVDRHADGVAKALEAVGSTVADLKKMETLVLQTVGLRALSELTLPRLLDDALACGKIGHHQTALYYYTAVVAMSHPLIPLRYSCSELHGAIARLVTCDNTAPALESLLVAAPAACEVAQACDGSPFVAALGKKERQRIEKIIAAHAAAVQRKEKGDGAAVLAVPVHVDPFAALDAASSPLKPSMSAESLSHEIKAAGSPVSLLSDLHFTDSEARGDASTTAGDASFLEEAKKDERESPPDPPAGLPADVAARADAKVAAMRFGAAASSVEAEESTRDTVDASFGSINVQDEVDALAAAGGDAALEAVGAGVAALAVGEAGAGAEQGGGGEEGAEVAMPTPSTVDLRPGEF